MDKVIELGKKLFIFFPSYIYESNNVNLACLYLEVEYDLRNDIKAALFYVLITENIDDAKRIIDNLNIEDRYLCLEIMNEVLLACESVGGFNE